MPFQLFQSCLTLCDPMDCDSSVLGILQARILEWVAMPSSRRSSQPRDRTCISCISCIAGRSFTSEPPGKPCLLAYWSVNNWSEISSNARSTKSLSLCQEALQIRTGVCVQLWQRVYLLVLAFTSFLCRGSKSAKGRLVPLRSFLSELAALWL